MANRSFRRYLRAGVGTLGLVYAIGRIRRHPGDLAAYATGAVGAAMMYEGLLGQGTGLQSLGISTPQLASYLLPRIPIKSGWEEAVPVLLQAIQS